MGSSIDLVMAYFEKISHIPRCSKDEARVAAWIQAWADDNGFAWKADPAGNLVIEVPGIGTGVSAAKLDVTAMNQPLEGERLAFGPSDPTAAGWLLTDLGCR